jgi:hypothetical protein
MVPIVSIEPHVHQDGASLFDLLQGATIQPMHMVIRMNVGTNEVSVGCGGSRVKELDAIAARNALERV